MYQSIKKTIFIFSVIISTGLSGLEIEEIVVKAKLIESSLLKLPNSITIIRNEEINYSHANHLEDILYLAPNVNYSKGASRGKFIQIRGIGERSEFRDPVNYSVGILVDGIDMTGIGLSASTFDVGQIEILRGPQGTLYGANALAGLINVSSKIPTNDFSTEVELGLSEYGGKKISIIVSDTPNLNLGYRVGFKNYKSDGYINNTYLRKNNTDNIDETNFKAKFKWKKERLSLDLTAIYSDADNGYDSFSLDNNRKTLSDQPGHDRQETQALSLNFLYEFHDTSVFEGLISFAQSDLEYGFDEDWSYPGICDGAVCDKSMYGFDWWYSSFDNYRRGNKNVTLDMRYLSKTSHFPWVLGIYNRKQTIDLLRIYTYQADDFKSNLDTTNTAIYGQVDLPLLKKFIFSSGFRFERREAHYIDNNAPAPNDFVCIMIYPKPESCLFYNNFKTAEDLWGGKISLSYALNGETNFYALISRGYKTGGVNTDGSIKEDNRRYDTETMLNYELGIKSIAANQKFIIHGSIFFQKRDDIQTKQSIVNSISDGVLGGVCPCSFTDYIGNAVSGKNYGIEIQADWFVNKELSFSTSIGLLDTEFDNYLSFSHKDADTNLAIPYNLEGRDQSHAPSYQYSISLHYQFDRNFFFKTSLEAKDSFYFSDRHNISSESYTLINLSAGYQNNLWEIILYSKNITDQDYQVRGFGSFGNDPRKFYAVESYYQYGHPKVFGLNVRKYF